MHVNQVGARVVVRASNVSEDPDSDLLVVSRVISGLSASHDRPVIIGDERPNVKALEQKSVK